MKDQGEHVSGLYSDGVGYESAGSTLTSEDFLPSDGRGYGDRAACGQGAAMRVGKTLSGIGGAGSFRKLSYIASGKLIETLIVRDETAPWAGSDVVSNEPAQAAMGFEPLVTYLFWLPSAGLSAAESPLELILPAPRTIPTVEWPVMLVSSRQPTKSYRARVTKVEPRRTGLMLRVEDRDSLLFEGENDE